MMNAARRLAAGLCGACLALAGCVQPGAIEAEALNRYSAALAAQGPGQRAGQSGLGLLLPVRSPAPKLPLQVDPNGGPPQVRLTLKDAVLRALAGNQDIRVVSFEPEISREEMLKAAAVFDAILFGGYQYNRVDELPPVVFLGGQTDTQTWQAGMRQLVPTGGSWSVSYSMTRLWDSSAFSTLPITYEPTLVLEVSQPLLRDFGPDYNLAGLRIARTNRKISEADFRSTAEKTIRDVIEQYWRLWQAQENVKVLRWRKQEAERIRDKVKARRDIDAGAAQIHQAEAAVMVVQVLLEQQEKAVQDAQDGLSRLLGDPQVNLMGEAAIVPVSAPAQAALRLDVADQLLTALEHSPALDKARLGVALAEINVTVARNQTLPRLDLTGSVGYQGLGPTPHEGMEKLGTLNYLSYGIGLSMEYPVGNRQRIAELRKTQFQRLQAVAAMQGAADQIALSVRERIREIERAYREIELQRELTQAKELELQALEDIERIRGSLTPEFLLLKLTSLTQLADARIGKLAAVRTYNVALADLAQITGTILDQYSVRMALPAAAGEAAWPDVSSPPSPGSPASRAGSRP